MSYTVTGLQLQEIQAQINRLTSLLTRPEGSPLDPDLVNACLRELLSNAFSSADLEIRDFDPDEFLYLSLPAAVLERSIDTLDLSARAKNALNREGIHRIGDLLEYAPKEMKFRNFGKGSLEEVKQKLAVQGWHLSRHDDVDLAPPLGDRWVQLENRKILRSRLLTREIGILGWSHSLVKDLENSGICTVGQLLELRRSDIISLEWRNICSTVAPDLVFGLLRRYRLDLRP